MKRLAITLVSTLAFLSSTAHAFISPSERTQLLASMNRLNPSQVQFQDIRCSTRSRICLVRLELGAQKTPVGCAIERIASTGDLFVENNQGLQLSAYSQNALNQCIDGFIR